MKTFHIALMIDTSAVGNFQQLFSFSRFNDIQSKCFHDLVNKDDNVVIASPTGSGKTTLFELAIIRSLRQHNEVGPTPLMFYTSPTKALCRERHQDWVNKFARFGVSCIEFTGDTESMDAFPPNSSIIITTPEKIDAWSRSGKSLEILKGRFQLLMLDEVHCVGDARGVVLEVLVSRFKALALTSLRIVAVSATIGNIGDFSSWLSSPFRPAISRQFAENTRPIPLTKHVLGFTSKENAFLFENSLSSQLPWIIKKYANGLPCLVFCSTRKSTELTAQSLAKSFQGSSIDNFVDGFTDKRLEKVIASKVAYHHAGLAFEDRRTLEYLFISGKVDVLCTTSTLAVGVNLPAHLVIIKGTSHYTQSGYQEYSKMEINQMLGRAGRPQFDTFGVGVILTEESKKPMYELLDDAMIVESRLPEIILSEFAIGTIKSLENAISWVRSTFFYQRNKNHDIKSTVEGIMEKLKRLHLIESSERGGFSVGAAAQIATKHYVNLETTETLIKIPQGCSPKDLLEHVCKSLTNEDCRFNSGDKSFLNGVLKSLAIRFPLDNDARIKAPWQKAFIILQLYLSKDDSIKWSASCSQDCRSLIPKIERILSCVIEMQLGKQDCEGLRNSIELKGAVAGGSWHDGIGVLEQVEGIGPAYAKKLGSCGIGTIAALREAPYAQIELFLKRNSPFGRNVVEAAKKLPHLELGYTVLTNSLIKVEPKADKGAGQTFYLICSSREKGTLEVKKFQGKDHLKVSANVNTAGSTQVTISWMSSSNAGLNVHKVIELDDRSKPDLWVPKSDMLEGKPLEYLQRYPNDTILSSDHPIPDVMKPVGLPPTPQSNKASQKTTSLCRHTCKNKSKCKHSCCKAHLLPEDPVSSNLMKISQVPTENHSPLRRAKRAAVADLIDKARQKKVMSWIDSFKRDPKEKQDIVELSSEPTSEIRIPVCKGLSVKEALRSINSFRFG